jgi:phenylalanyl-tRNA synthetase alpha subunit
MSKTSTVTKQSPNTIDNSYSYTRQTFRIDEEVGANIQEYYQGKGVEIDREDSIRMFKIAKIFQKMARNLEKLDKEKVK